MHQNFVNLFLFRGSSIIDFTFDEWHAEFVEPIFENYKTLSKNQPLSLTLTHNNQNIEKLCLKSYLLLAQELPDLTVFFISHAFGKKFLWKQPARSQTDTQELVLDMTPW